MLQEKIQKECVERQKIERVRAKRIESLKKIWKHCKDMHIQLGRIPLLSSVVDDDEYDENEYETRWHHHHPHTGRIPELIKTEWAWPCMFVYPSVQQSDFIEQFYETEMLAIRMADVLPELEEGEETEMTWDIENNYKCSLMAVYCEVHFQENEENMIDPDSVKCLLDQSSTIQYYERSRSLRGDDGSEMAHLATCVERKYLYEQRKEWKKKHGSLWNKPGSCPVLRVHPATTLRNVLTHKQIVVPNFLVTFLMFPEKHKTHEKFLNERKCIGVIQS